MSRIKTGDNYISGRGFTLAELLIVVAIIAVLVAVAVPVFAGQLEKSREAADLANVRGAFAEVAAAAISDDHEAAYNGKVIYHLIDGEDVYAAEVPLKQKKQGWQSDTSNLEIAGVRYSDENWINEPVKNGVCTVSITDGILKLDWGGTEFVTIPFITYADTIRSTIKDYFAVSEKPIEMSSWDSTYPNANVVALDNIRAALAGAEDIKSWTVINSKYKKSGDKFSGAALAGNKDEAYFKDSEKDLYYLWTGINIKDKQMAGKKVPVMVAYTDSQGRKVYSVTDITVVDKGYNVISNYEKDGTQINMSDNSREKYSVNELLEYNGKRVDYSTDYTAAYNDYMNRLNTFRSSN